MNKMRREGDEVTILFAIRYPFTDLATTRVGDDKIDIGIDVKDQFAGRLRVDVDDIVDIMVQGFAESRRPVGVIIGGRVTWNVDPNKRMDLRTVIDDRGRLHDVAKLGE